MYKCQDKYVHC